MQDLAISLPFSQRVLLIIAVAIAAHVLVMLVRKLGASVTGAEKRVHAKVRTAMSLLVSSAVFAIYFIALGLVLHEFGVSLTAYFASVSIIGIAVGFGSQGLVQDVVTGLTLIFSDIFDLGDMVELGGQTGVVKQLGIRFTVLTNYMGAEVFVPNRTINNVINYPKGYVRAIVDFSLSGEEAQQLAIKECIEEQINGVYEQLPGLFRAKPSIEGLQTTSAKKQYLRVKFRIWPGQGGPLESVVRKQMVEALKTIDANYAEWMVMVTYEVETKQVKVS